MQCPLLYSVIIYASIQLSSYERTTNVMSDHLFSPYGPQEFPFWINEDLSVVYYYQKSNERERCGDCYSYETNL